MRVDPIAQSLAALNRFAGSETARRLGLYEPAQRLVKAAVKEGFKASGVVARQFKAAQKLVRPERPTDASERPDRFDLNLTEEQQMIREMTQRFAAEVVRPAAEKADAELSAPAGFDAQFGELGLCQFVVPEALGGAATERSVVTQVLVSEALAHGDMGLSVAALAPVGVATALTRWGSAAQQSRYLPAFASADMPKATLAIAEPRPAFDPYKLRTRAQLDGGGYVISGEKALVPIAAQAELLLVAAEVVGKGPAVFVVEAGTQGLGVEPAPAQGVRAAGLCRVKLDRVRVAEDAILGGAPAVGQYQELIDASNLAVCALAVGTAQAVLDYVIPYCNDRVAFGEPISHRQAVAFMIANIAIELEAMRLLTWRAAARAEQGLSYHREAYLAHVLCCDKALEIGTNGVQLLGGAGFIKDHPMERFYRDLMGVGVMQGGLLV